MVFIYTTYTIITYKSGSFVHKLYLGLQFSFESYNKQLLFS